MSFSNPELWVAVSFILGAVCAWVAPSLIRKQKGFPGPRVLYVPGYGSQSKFHCSFCGKSQHEVGHIVAGSNVCICNECTEACVEALSGLKRPKIEITKNFVDYYNLSDVAEKRGKEGSYHLPGGWLRNQFLNMDVGDDSELLVSVKELLFTCIAGEFEIESHQENFRACNLSKAPGVVQQDQKSIKLTQWDQAVLSAESIFAIVCTKKGTLQIVGDYVRPGGV